ncbi:hypothetical protein ACOMHN_051886 [Nucella lapillus]
MSSNYSTGYLVPYTSNQALLRHKEQVMKEKYLTKMAVERMHLKPPLYDASPERLAMARSVYGVRLRPRPPDIRMYDRINKLPPDWDPKAKHDAYRLQQHYMVNARVDEDNRAIPIMTNSEMGHRLNACPETFRRDHARVMVFHHSLYRNNGINMGTDNQI